MDTPLPERPREHSNTVSCGPIIETKEGDLLLYRNDCDSSEVVGPLRPLIFVREFSFGCLIIKYKGPYHYFYVIGCLTIENILSLNFSRHCIILYLKGPSPWDRHITYMY